VANGLRLTGAPRKHAVDSLVSREATAAVQS